ncbi:MAG: DUF4360 domain-containing protein [Oligoflexus sp.]
MSKNILATLGTMTLTIAAPALAKDMPTPPTFSIKITDVYGEGCPNKRDIWVEIAPTGHYYIRAQFNDYQDFFYAITSEEETTSRVNCIIDYEVQLHPDYKLDYAEFYVDGEYHLSEAGTAFASIRHNVPGVDHPVFHNMTRSVENEDPAHGNFQFFGSIDGIDERVNHCGATIPLQVQLRATARRSKIDVQETFVAIDNGDGRFGEREGVRQIDCYGRVVSCK